MSAINVEKISIAHWYPDLETHKCGYCKNPNGAVSYGMWAEQLTVEDYQNLIDRGWRRSGMYCYKPMMDQTCCPQYTIRCSAMEFQLSKSQKKIIKKFNKFVTDGLHNKSDNQSNNQTDNEENTAHEQVIIKERPSVTMDIVNKLGSSNIDCEMNSGDFQNETDNTVVAGCSNSTSSHAVESDIKSTIQETIENKPGGNFKKGIGADPNKPLCKKAKLIRLERKQQKLVQKGMNVEKQPSNSEAKTLEQFLNEIPEESKHKLKIELVPTIKFDKEMESIKNTEFQLYKKYQMTIHNDPPEKCTMLGFKRFLISSPLKIKHERVNKNHSSFKTCAELFKKYQMAVHNEPLNECGEKQFCEFLVDTPLKCVRVRGQTSVVTFGTFHQQYWLDDKLIAVAVLDILPRCVSSVYFFYDPDYRFLTLGTYGSLREVGFVRSLHKSIPAIKHYYMGYYIHSCPKMRYKGKLSHSSLLCPETYQWFSIEKCFAKLDTNKYSRLNDDIDAIDENICTSDDIDSIKVCVSYSFTLFGNYKRKYGEQEVFDNIGRLIGKQCASTILFVSSKG